MQFRVSVGHTRNTTIRPTDRVWYMQLYTVRSVTRAINRAYKAEASKNPEIEAQVSFLNGNTLSILSHINSKKVKLS